MAPENSITNSLFIKQPDSEWEEVFDVQNLSTNDSFAIGTGILKGSVEPEKPLESRLISDGGIIGCRNQFKNRTEFTSIMPEVTDVKVFDSRTKADKEEYCHVLPKTVVKLFFADDTTETAVIDEHDYLIFDNLLRGGEQSDIDKVSQFLMEQGISICITKKLLSIDNAGVGSSLYNKIVRRIVKMKKQNDKAAIREAAERKAAEQQKKTQEKKDREKKQRRCQQDYQRQVDILVAALKKAFAEDN